MAKESKYAYLEEFILKEVRNGTRTRVIYGLCRDKGYEGTDRQFYKFLYNLKKKNGIEQVESGNGERDRDVFLEILTKNKIVDLSYLCNTFNCTPLELQRKYINHFRNLGYEISTDSHRVFLSKDHVFEPEPVKRLESKEIDFGIASDLHFGSKAVQITALNEFCETCRQLGIKYIFVPGDVVAGLRVYPGQEYDLYAHSAEEQAESVLANLPSGFTWFIMGGNHDYAFMKNGGHNIINAIAAQRDDIVACGFDMADVEIMQNVHLRMWHPKGGIPYALSYRLQKGIEQIAQQELKHISNGSKDKPSIKFVAAGHLHTSFYGRFGDITGFQSGAFEGTTNYLKRLGLNPSIGGWTYKCWVNKDGFVGHNPFFWEFKEIEDDYKNYRHTFCTENKCTGPLFE